MTGHAVVGRWQVRRWLECFGGRIAADVAADARARDLFVVHFLRWRPLGGRQCMTRKVIVGCGRMCRSLALG